MNATSEDPGIFIGKGSKPVYLSPRLANRHGLIAGATLLGAPLPLTAAQILLVNLATDGLPAIALAVDPVEEDVMSRAPRDPRSWPRRSRRSR